MPMPIAVFDGDVRDAALLGPLGQSLDHEDGDAANDEGDRDHFRVPEQRLDMLQQDEAEDRRWQESDQDVADEPPRYGIAPEQALDHRPEGAPVKYHDREDRAELDDDVEGVPLRVVIAEQGARQDQMPGRGHGQEFGDALDDAEDDRDQQDGHARLRWWRSG